MTQTMAYDQEFAKRPLKIGLALGSGVARGWAHIGALRALLDRGITPEFVAGTSIGAVVGGCWAAGKLDELETFARSITRLRMVGLMDFTIGHPGLLKGDRLNAEMETHLSGIRQEDLPTPLASVAADMLTGREMVLRRGPLIPNLRASYAMPGVFPPVEIDGRFLFDGGMVNPVPVSATRALGADVVIAVNLNADVMGRNRVNGTGYSRVAGFDIQDVLGTGGVSMNGTVRRMIGVVFGRQRADQPSMFGVMMSSLSIITDRLTRTRLAGDPPDVHITPKIGHIGMAEFDRAEELIDLGRAAVEANLDALHPLRVRPPPRGQSVPSSRWRPPECRRRDDAGDLHRTRSVAISLPQAALGTARPYGG